MKHREIEAMDPLVWDILRMRSLSGACTLVFAAAILFCFKAWFLAAVACIAALITLSTFIFSARDSLEGAMTGISFMALFAVVIGGSAFAYLDLGLAFSDNNGRVLSYQDALYFSVITWTTVGYGDIKPLPSARLWAAGQALYGTLYMGLLVAYILKVLTIQRIRESRLLRGKVTAPNTYEAPGCQ